VYECREENIAEKYLSYSYIMDWLAHYSLVFNTIRFNGVYSVVAKMDFHVGAKYGFFYARTISTNYDISWTRGAFLSI